MDSCRIGILICQGNWTGTGFESDSNPGYSYAIKKLKINFHNDKFSYMKMVNFIVYVTSRYYIVVTYSDFDSFYLNITRHIIYVIIQLFWVYYWISDFIRSNLHLLNPKQIGSGYRIGYHLDPYLCLNQKLKVPIHYQYPCFALQSPIKKLSSLTIFHPFKS